MKKGLFFILYVLHTTTIFSQEIQLHFDPRHALHSDVTPRNYFTVTFQGAINDKLGSTYGFIDMDFNRSKGNIGLAYLELKRDFTFRHFPLMTHIEFNGGISLGQNDSGFSIPNAYMAGIAYKPFSKQNITTYLLYKYNAFEKSSNDVQLSCMWAHTFLKGKFTLSGFVDIWTENKDRVNGLGGKKIILLTEPQVWLNLNRHFAVGSEIEISNNFYARYKNKVYICPTIALKWIL